ILPGLISNGFGCIIATQTKLISTSHAFSDNIRFVDTRLFSPAMACGHSTFSVHFRKGPGYHVLLQGDTFSHRPSAIYPVIPSVFEGAADRCIGADGSVGCVIFYY
ncbi:MAG: hypothetical protein MR894_01515, partial [Akkermansia muciniphila]|nr:hypothetical protein [Akkermansia muciniphila]